MSYRIVRKYASNTMTDKVIKRGLTEEEAKAWCRDPQTSSRTCTTEEGRERTRLHGAWFDAFEGESDADDR